MAQRSYRSNDYDPLAGYGQESAGGNARGQRAAGKRRAGQSDPAWDSLEWRGQDVPQTTSRQRRKRRRKKRRGGAGVAVALFVPIIILLIAACFLLYQRLPNPKKDLIGVWRTSEDLTAAAASAAQTWLDGAALGSTVRAADYFSMDAPILANTDLTLLADGGYTLALDQTGYQTAQTNASAALADALVDLIGVRLRAAGRDDAYAQGDVVRKLFRQATTLSPEEYLTIYGPALLPAPEEKWQAVAASGRYALDLDGGLLLWDGAAQSPYVLNGDLLLLTGDVPPGNHADAPVLFQRLADTPQAGRAPSGSTFFSDVKAFLSKHPIALNAHAAKNFRIVENLPVSTGSGARKTVKAIHADYENNRFLSLRDLAGALQGTAREFSLTVTTSSVAIDTTGSYDPVGGENEPFALGDDEIYSTGDLRANDLTVDGRTVKYYTYLGKNTAGKADCFMNLTDFCLIFHVNADLTDGVLTIDASTRDLSIDMTAMRAAGFYDEIRGALVGDATTGEIYESWRADLSIPIASTTKLMTYAVLMDAVTAGEISLGDTVTISAKTAALSQGQDRVIPMTEGQETNVRELLQAMLIASSNESALALAEHLAGSEEAFVERMQKKAVELGLSEATTFYNCNGLPTFADDIATAKRQNQMSAGDMFLLASHLLTVYPQITEITSKKNASLPTLKMDIKTTNALLYNLEDAVGLKTGTTDMAGPCLVGCIHITGADGGHDLVSVVLGAENNHVRFTSSEVLLRYGKQLLLNGSLETAAQTSDSLPSDAEGIVRLVLSYQS